MSDADPRNLRKRIAAALADQTSTSDTVDDLMGVITAELDARDARIAGLEADRDQVRRTRDRYRDERNAARERITELEAQAHGTLDRRCVIPGCSASYRADTGPAPGQRWMRSTSPSILLCPDHAHLMTGDTPHTPRLDHITRTCACSCGQPLPGPTLGHMGTAWIAHALNLLEARAVLGEEPTE